VRRRLERGLTLLASIAATAPFIGLLGTVWSIYRALEKLALADHATAGGVIGPVGESLIMTALGLGVAIPAVLGYNLLGRLVRDLADDLDGFAHDLHAWACGLEGAVLPSATPLDPPGGGPATAAPLETPGGVSAAAAAGITADDPDVPATVGDPTPRRHT
ncbi:MAG: MotA/TolQ/ExbB proton channel family protein, partial [Janthinobacterium lividum]